MGEIWARMGRGCPPSTPRHFWVIFGKVIFSQKNDQNHEHVYRPETMFFFSKKKCTNEKGAYRHNSDFGGPMSSPSSIWSPFVKKKCFKAIFEEIKTIFGGRDSGRLEMGVQGAYWVAPCLDKPIFNIKLILSRLVGVLTAMFWSATRLVQSYKSLSSHH